MRFTARTCRRRPAPRRRSAFPRSGAVHLDGHAAIIATRPQGYVIAVGGDRLDSAQFEKLVAQAQRGARRRSA